MQWLSQIAVRRPVFATVLILVFVVVGAVGYKSLGVDKFPKIDFPLITIVTPYPGASPLAVESDISKKIEEADFDLPLARPRESEQEYNLRAGAARGVYCLDRQCSRVAGDKIELCDLYISERNFVHVKKWTASSTLSHLYMQGKASAEALLADEEFRREARTLLSGKSASLVQQIPVGRPDPTKYTVVFAIIKAGRMGWQRDLPFFSQLHLVRTAESLRTLGFNVRVARIGVEL